MFDIMEKEIIFLIKAIDNYVYTFCNWLFKIEVKHLLISLSKYSMFDEINGFTEYSVTNSAIPVHKTCDNRYEDNDNYDHSYGGPNWETAVDWTLSIALATHVKVWPKSQIFYVFVEMSNYFWLTVWPFGNRRLHARCHIPQTFGRDEEY